MAMSDKNSSEEEIKNVFEKARFFKNIYSLKDLSMGMSDDYKIAIKCGATFVRLGRILYY